MGLLIQINPHIRARYPIAWEKERTTAGLPEGKCVQDGSLESMNGPIASRLTGEFLFAFGALFAIINPFGVAFVFLDKTMNLSESERASIALRVSIYAFGVLLASLFVGSNILHFFGISIPALRIAGGLVVAVSGWSMLHAPPRTQNMHTTSTAGFSAIQKLAFFPLTIPLTAGPGTIATAIAIGTTRQDDSDLPFAAAIAWLLTAIAVSATIYLAYRRSSAMARLFGEEGTSIITRLSAFLLLCVGVQIMITGISEVARSLLERA